MKNMAMWSIFHDAVGPISASKLNKILERYPVEWLFSEKASLIKDELSDLALKRLDEFLSVREYTDIEVRKDFLEKQNIKLLTKADDAYPSLLAKIYDAPSILYVKGEFTNKLHIGMVGSRKASSYGQLVSLKMAEELSKEDVCVVSGLARGIDSKAHEGALLGSGGTVAVLGTGLNIVYPSENKKLFDKILSHSNGVIVTELPLNEGPKPYHFPRRNRIITGLSSGILVVEATDKSGALITATIAMEEGRDVFAIPGQITSRESVGCHRLIKDGAKLVSNKLDILEEYGQLALFNPLPLDNKSEKESITLTDKEAIVYKLIDNIPIGFEELVLKSKLSVPELTGILNLLELNDLIEELLGRQYIKKRLT